ncbi:hypothetical protein G7046_g6273 [Stylonectria norvegica]|nr:hypothetical protein G7046_g6273 [Stylonectria norvegica]
MASSGVSFTPDLDIPSQSGKFILITGANTGLGKQTALELAKHHPSEIWITARNAERGNAAVKEIKTQSPDVSVFFLELDLASFDSIKSAAKKFLSSTSRLDLLFLNAGILGCPPALTKDGYEIQFGTNHLGHALLLKLLTPRLVQTASEPAGTDVRVVSLSSIGYAYVGPEGIQFETLKDNTKDITPLARYVQSKLANLLYAQEVAKRYPQFTTVSVHPGSVTTELFSREAGDETIKKMQINRPSSKVTVEDGAKTQLWAATADGVVSGQYYEPVGVADAATGFANDKAMAQKLWEWTERELEGHEI